MNREECWSGEGLDVSQRKFFVREGLLERKENVGVINCGNTTLHGVIPFSKYKKARNLG